MKVRFFTVSVFLVSMALLALLVPGGARSTVAQAPIPEGLVLWNKLGSDDEVLHSEVGENGTIVGTAYAYEPAKHGNGYVRKTIRQNYVKFPASVLNNLRYRGTIELWINPKVSKPVPYQYGIFGLLGTPYGWGWGVPQDCNVCLTWGDTVTGRGLQGAIRFDQNSADTPPEPTQFVATPFVPFHVAICWDIAGIDGTTDKVRVYRDGKIVGSTTASWNPNGAEKYDIILGYGPDNQGFDKFISDNIIIWNYAKTDFSDRFNESPLPVVAELDLDPDTLNLKSKGKWVTAYIELPAGYDVANIDLSTVRLQDTIQAVTDPKYDFVSDPSEYLVDRDGDGDLERMVKFSQAEVVSGLSLGDVTLAVTGKVNGMRFEGSDTIRVK